MRALTNPITLIAIVVLLLNDHVFKVVSPSWWTGKISDFAGLICAPLLIAVPLAMLIPRRKLNANRHAQRVGLIAFMLIGVGFAAIKTIPAANSAAIAIMSALLGGSVQIVRDPTDLIALPMLLIGWQIWQHAATPNKLAVRRSWFVLALGAFACVATSQIPNDLGLTCLETQNNGLVFFPYQHFSSSDGGLQWNIYAPTQHQYGSKCGYKRTFFDSVYIDPTHPNIEYQLNSSSISRRVAQNELWGAWVTEFSWAEPDTQANITYREMLLKAVDKPTAYYETSPKDAIIDSQTGNLIVAMGFDGVIVRTASDGQYQRVAVGEYAYVQPNLFVITSALIQKDLWIILAFAILNLTTMRTDSGFISTSFYFISITTWLLWMLSIIFLAVNRPSDAPSQGVQWIFSIFAVGVLILIAFNIPIFRRQVRHSIVNQVIISQIPVLGMLELYILWGFGLLYDKSEIFLFAIVITVIVRIAAVRRTRHNLKRLAQAENAAV